MLKKYRRVVTGHDKSGRSVVISDDVSPGGLASPDRPNQGRTSIWMIDRSTASNREVDLIDLETEPPGFPPAGSGGSSFMIMELPPESELDAMPPDQRERAMVPVVDVLPEAIDVGGNKFYGMHATDTVDLLLIVSGEVSVMVDEGEVTLRPGDTMIQRGGNHGWINRGSEPAIVAAFVVDAEPLDRSARLNAS